MKRPFILFGTTTIIAICFFNLLGFNFTAVVFGAAIILFPVLFFIKSKYKFASYAFICVLALLVSCGSFCTKTVTDYLPAVYFCSDSEQTVSGVLYKYENSYGGHYYTLKNAVINGTQTKSSVRVHSSSYQAAEIDDTVTFPSAIIYKAGESNGNSDSYKADGIYLSAYSSSDFSVIAVQKHSLNFYLNELREYISESFSPVDNSNISSVSVAMLTGDKSDMDESVLNNFRYAGISHLFAVSGFHLTMWTSAISMICNGIFKKKKFISPIISIIFVLFFMALTGFTKSVTRAGIMMLILLSGKLIRRNADSLNSLFLAGSLILIANPYSIMSLSLQLSFLATFGIILISKPLSESISRIEKQLKNKIIFKTVKLVYSVLSVSVVASIFTLPVSAINFGHFSLWAPITNILCLPAAEIMMMLSAIAVIFSPVGAVSKPILVVTTLIARYIMSVTQTTARFDSAVVDTSSTLAKIIFTVVITAVILLILILNKNGKAVRISVFTSYAIIISISLSMLAIQSDSVKITVPDVGNGTALVLKIKDKDIIIGCGGPTYKSYKFTTAADSNTMNYDLIIIPRNNTTENAYIYTVLSRYDFDSCVCYQWRTHEYNLSYFPDNTYITDYYAVNLDENSNLVYINNDDFTGVRIESDIFTCTIIFRPSVDFSSVDESWQTGSLLITRQSLPDIDLSGFENIIVSSSADTVYGNENIYSTAYSGKITYRMYPFSFASITEEKNDIK